MSELTLLSLDRFEQHVFTPKIALVQTDPAQPDSACITDIYRETFLSLCCDNLTKATGYHFNQAGHSISDMTVTIIEKVHNKDELFRKEREKF